MKKHAELVTAGSPKSSGIPRAAGFNGFLRGLPGEPGLLSPSPAVISASLIPASGYQDATTSPSAGHAFVFCALRVHRIFRPTFGDDRETPLLTGRKTRGNLPVICPSSQASRLRQIGTTGKSGEVPKFVVAECQYASSLRGALATKQSRALLRPDWIASLRSQ
jgi:hypothetical protein